LKSTPVVGFRLDNLPADGGVHRFQVIWKHQGSESAAEVKASIPQASVSLRPRWIAPTGIAAVVVVVLLIVAATMRKSRKPIEAPAQSVAAPVDLSPPTPTPLPPRQHRGTPAPLRSPLEAEKVSSAAREAAPSTRSKTEILARFPSPEAGRPAAWLFCEEGFAPGERFPVEHVEYWIGSLEGNHLHIVNDPTVSSHHACLVFDHEVLGIYDHHSTNGTSVNDELVSENRRLLRPGDRIRVGQSIFTVQSAGPEGLRL
jgi:Inner membrane component of T3SS, cytoplasmic domain